MPKQPSGSGTMGDFDACRFDFRLDAKNGLMPSKRKRSERCSQVNYGTLFKCKICSSLFPSRPQLLEHKTYHLEYSCDICSQRFSKRSLLLLHCNSVHQISFQGRGGLPGYETETNGGSQVNFEPEITSEYPGFSCNSGKSSEIGIRPLTSEGHTLGARPLDTSLSIGNPSNEYFLSIPEELEEPNSDPLGSTSRLFAQADALLTSQPTISPLTQDCSLNSDYFTSLSQLYDINLMPLASTVTQTPKYLCMNVPAKTMASPDDSSSQRPPSTTSSLIPVPDQDPPRIVIDVSGSFIPKLHLPDFSSGDLLGATGGITSSLIAAYVAQLQGLQTELKPDQTGLDRRRVTELKSGQHVVVDSVERERMDKPNHDNFSKNNNHCLQPAHKATSLADTVCRVKPEPAERSAYKLPSSWNSHNSFEPFFSRDVATKTATDSKPYSANTEDECALDYSVKKAEVCPRTSEDVKEVKTGCKDVVKVSEMDSVEEIIDLSYGRSSCTNPSVYDNNSNDNDLQYDETLGLIIDTEESGEPIGEVVTTDMESQDGDCKSKVRATRVASDCAAIDGQRIAVQNGGAQQSRKRKAGGKDLSNMVEKLWKSKMNSTQSPGHAKIKHPDGCDVFQKTVSIKVENSSESELQNSFKMQSETSMNYSNSKDSAQLHQTCPPSSAFCTIKFRACPVCRQLFESAKAMWDHAASHTEYRKSRVWKMKKKSSEEDNETLPDPTVSRESDTVTQESVAADTDHVASELQIVLMEPEAIPQRSATIDAIYRCNYPDCEKTFDKEHQLKVHEVIHTGDVTLACRLCRYACRHDSLLLWHMENKHGMQRQRLDDGQSVYLDAVGRCVVDLHDKASSCESSSMCAREKKKEEKSLSSFSDDTYANSYQIPNANCKQDDMLSQYVMSVDCSNGGVSSVKEDYTSDDKSDESDCCDRVSEKSEAQELRLTLRRITPASNVEASLYTPINKPTLPSAQQYRSPIEQLRTKLRLAKKSIQCACTICGEVFQNEVALTEHMPSCRQTDVTKFFCDTCGVETGASQDDLKIHLMAAHGKELGELKGCSCHVCGRGYASQEGLLQHIQEHSSESSSQAWSQLVCPVGSCTSRHSSKGSLKNHVRRVHLDGNSAHERLSCLRSGCSKRFDSETTLLNHLAVHSEERPLVCAYVGCEKAFRELKHLKVHQMQHTDTKPLRCDRCEYSCRQRNSMNWHMKSKHHLEKHVTPDGKTFYA